MAESSSDADEEEMTEDDVTNEQMGRKFSNKQTGREFFCFVAENFWKMASKPCVYVCVRCVCMIQ